jgi:hypothetical protein
MATQRGVPFGEHEKQPSPAAALLCDRDINTHQTTVMDVATNVFCASGMHLPNGSFVTFGGNGAIGPGGTAHPCFYYCRCHFVVLIISLQ